MAIRAFPKIRDTILGPHNKDYSILVSILGPPIGTSETLWALNVYYIPTWTFRDVMCHATRKLLMWLSNVAADGSPRTPSKSS